MVQQAPGPLHGMADVIVGELLFIDENNTILWQENHKTSIERYTNYIAAQGIPARDLTSWDA